MSTLTRKQGEYVALEFSSADASTAAAITVKDSNGATRTVASNERLLIDTLSAAGPYATDPANDISVSIFNDLDGNGTVAAGERIMVYRGNGVFDGGAEGFSVKPNTSVKVKASASGQIDVTGIGRIIKSGTTGARESWREKVQA
jgi:hypothetical protein